MSHIARVPTEAPAKRRPTAAELTDARIATDRAVARMLAAQQATEVETFAVGVRATAKRRKRVDPLVRLRLHENRDRDQALRHAAIRYRQAYEHMCAGRGLGPMPWGKDEPMRGGGAPMPAQIRALSAATCYRRGVQALGMAASQGVVHWVVIAGLPLGEYDEVRGWRKGRGKGELVLALERLAAEYGV